MTNLTLIGYCRVSRVGDRGGESFVSPEVQRDKITAYAAAHGHTIGEWITDLDESGGTMQRPGFERAMRAIEAGKASGVIVAKLDRFARTLEGALAAIRRLDEAGAAVVVANDGIDPTTVGGKAAFRILLVIAEMQRDMIRAEWQSSREKAIERGAYISARAPIGYDRDDDGRLVPNERAATVLAAFEARAVGAGISDVARLLDVSRPAARKLLANPAYIGQARHGEHVNESAHEPIVPRELFELAKVARGAGTGRANGGEGLLLSGLIRCATCRHAMSSGKTEAGRRRYRCINPACGERASIDSDAIEANVRALYAMFVASPAASEATASDELRQALEAAEAELSAFVRVMRATEPGYREGHLARAAVVAQARRQLAAVASPEAVALDDDEPVSEQRRKLSAWIVAVFIRPGRGTDMTERCRIVYDGTDVELPSRGNKSRRPGPYEFAA